MLGGNQGGPEEGDDQKQLQQGKEDIHRLIGQVSRQVVAEKGDRLQEHVDDRTALNVIADLGSPAAHDEGGDE